MSRTETDVREKLRGLDPGSHIGGVGLGEEVQPLLPVGLGQCSSRSRSAISAHIEISASNYILPADSGMVDHRVLTPWMRADNSFRRTCVQVPCRVAQGIPPENLAWTGTAVAAVPSRCQVELAMIRSDSRAGVPQGRMLLEWCRSTGLIADFVAQLPAGDDAEFAEDFLQVILDGVGGDEQPVSDFLVRVADGVH